MYRISVCVFVCMYMSCVFSVCLHKCIPCIDLGLAYEKRSAWTCWVSGVKFNHGSTSTVPVDGDRVTALHTIAKIYAIELNMKHLASGTPTARGCLTAPGMQHAVGEAISLAIVLVSGHDRSQCTTTKDRSRKKTVMEAL